MENLLKKKLIIFSGKGGVGKSTLSSAFGLCAAQKGKRVLLVEIDPRATIPRLFEKDDVPVYQEVRLHNELSYLNIDPLLALQEYIVLKLGFRRLYERLFGSRVYQVFVQASPGLKEIVTLGKIWDLEQKGRYDLIILDAPSTGHAIPFLSVPGIIISALRIGPIVQEALKIRDFLSDPVKTVLNIVTVPEEMAVNEALEMWKAFRPGKDITPGSLFVNEVIPRMISPNESAALKKIPAAAPYASLIPGVTFLASREEIQEVQLSRLGNVIPGDVTYRVPLLFSPSFGAAEINDIARILEGLS